MPTIRLETLNITAGNLSVAMYHQIPTAFYSPESVDQARVPAGTGLDANELADLKSGHLVETIVDIPIEGKNVNTLRGVLMLKWGDMTPEVHRRYKGDYSYTSRIWDGTWR